MNATSHTIRWIGAAMMVAALAFATACGSEDDAAGGVAPRASRGETQSGTSGAALPPAEADGATLGDEATVPQSTTGGGAAPLPAQLDRKIIQVSTLTVSTDSVSQNFENVGNIAAGAGGYVASSTYGNEGDRQSASITIKVPGTAYNETIVKLRALGDVTREESSSDDVSEQFVDLESRLRNLRATEAQYLEFLDNARDLNETLLMQDRINGVRAEIEQVQGRIDLLAKQTDFATITTHLVMPIAAKSQPSDGNNVGNPLEAADQAFDASLVVLLGIATVALAAVAFGWWLLPLIAVALYVVRRQAASRRGVVGNPRP